MYEQFFGFSRSGISQRPFVTTPSPDCFFATSAIEETLLEVKQCLTEGRGLALLAAPSGMGKTLFCKKLIAEMASEFQTVFLENAQFPTRRSFLQTILYELGHGYIRQGEEEVRIMLKELLSTLQPPQSAVLLVIDEADHLSRRMLDEVRALSNLTKGENPLVRILLCGSLALEEHLALPENSACYQRVACQVTLEPLTIQESVSYVEYRIQRVGSTLEKTFHPDGLEAICQASDGLPRAINQLSDHSLMLSYLAEQSPVDLPVVLEALDDLKQLPLCWNEPTAAKKTYEETESDVELDSNETYEFENPQAITTEEPQTEGAFFEVGSFEVGADIPTEPLVEIPVVIETSQREEIKEEEQAISSPVVEETGASFEIGAEVMSLQEEFIPLVEDSDEPELLITEQQEEEILLATEAGTGEAESMTEDSTVEIVFDRYALIDSDDSLSQNYINLTDAISKPLYREEEVSQSVLSHNISDKKEMIETKQAIEFETAEVETGRTNLQKEEKIRTHLIQVCQKTRKAVGYQLNVLEEIWEASHSSNPTIENLQTTEPETYLLETSHEENPIQLDLFSAETKGKERHQPEPEEQETTVDLVAMRQRLSQRFKQLRLKQG